MALFEVQIGYEDCDSAILFGALTCFRLTQDLTPPQCFFLMTQERQEKWMLHKEFEEILSKCSPYSALIRNPGRTLIIVDRPMPNIPSW